jgi:hypothetical protein
MTIRAALLRDVMHVGHLAFTLFNNTRDIDRYRRVKNLAT